MLVTFTLPTNGDEPGYIALSNVIFSNNYHDLFFKDHRVYTREEIRENILNKKFSCVIWANNWNSELQKDLLENYHQISKIGSFDVYIPNEEIFWRK